MDVGIFSIWIAVFVGAATISARLFEGWENRLRQTNRDIKQVGRKIDRMVGDFYQAASQIESEDTYTFSCIDDIIDEFGSGYNGFSSFKCDAMEVIKTSFNKLNRGNIDLANKVNVDNVYSLHYFVLDKYDSYNPRNRRDRRYSYFIRRYTSPEWHEELSAKFVEYQDLNNRRNQIINGYFFATFTMIISVIGIVFSILVLVTQNLLFPHVVLFALILLLFIIFLSSLWLYFGLNVDKLPFSVSWLSSRIAKFILLVIVLVVILFCSKLNRCKNYIDINSIVSKTDTVQVRANVSNSGSFETAK